MLKPYFQILRTRSRIMEWFLWRISEILVFSYELGWWESYICFCLKHWSGARFGSTYTKTPIWQNPKPFAKHLFCLMLNPAIKPFLCEKENTCMKRNYDIQNSVYSNLKIRYKWQKWKQLLNQSLELKRVDLEKCTSSKELEAI